MDRQIVCGAAKKIISPQENVLTRVRGLMMAKFSAVADDLYVRAMALKSGDDTALFIEIDLDKAPYPAEVLERVSSAHSIPEENIFYFSTHTHSVPAIGDRSYEPHHDTKAQGGDIAAATVEYEQFVMGRIDECVSEALSDMRPCSIGYGYIPSQCNANRERPVAAVNDEGKVVYGYSAGPNIFGPADKNLYVVEVKDSEGSPFAFLVNYAVHNTTMFMNTYDDEGNCAVSCDFGGMLSQLIEKQFPGSVALWSSGAAGDVAPLNAGGQRGHNEDSGRPKEYLRQRSNMLDLSCTQLGDFMHVIEKMDSFMESGTISGGVGFTETPAQKVIREGHKIVDIVDDVDNPYKVRVHVLRVGELGFCGIGGELYSNLGFAIREAFPLKKLVLITHDASMICDPDYILDDDACRNMRNLPEGAPGPRGVPMRMKAGYIKDALVEKSVSLLRATL